MTGKKSIPMLSVAAWSGSGKTTLLEKIIRELTKRGVKVAVIKHDGHDFELDKPGKDTWRFAEAGASSVVISSFRQTALIERRGRSLMEAAALIPEADLILVEGYKQEPITQIGLCRKDSKKPFTAPLHRYIAVVTDVLMDAESLGIPQFDLEDVDGIVTFILQNMDRFTCFCAEYQIK